MDNHLRASQSALGGIYYTYIHTYIHIYIYVQLYIYIYIYTIWIIYNLDLYGNIICISWYVLFVNVKNRRGTPWSTIPCTDCSVASRVVVMVQLLAHLTCNPGDAGSFPIHGKKCFFIRKGSVSSSLSLFVHSSLNTSITKRRVSFGSY